MNHDHTTTTTHTGGPTVLERWPKALMGTYPTPPMTIASAHGAELVDTAGTHYLDLLSGIAVNALGHAHPAIVEAVSRQIATVGHTSNLLATEPVVEVAEQLQRHFTKRHPGTDCRVFFCNSGTEANEAAIKIARLAGKRHLMAAEHGFHGRTLGALSITGQPGKQDPFRPLLDGVEFFPFGDLEALRARLSQQPVGTAAIFLEPIQGETGVIPAPEGYLRGVRALCDEFDALLVFDEVQTGVGRTGDFFAFQHEGVLPDVATMAKGLGGGLPIGAVIARAEVATLVTPGTHGTTFGGNPVACAAARAVLSVLDDDMIAEVRRKGEKLAHQVADIDGVRYVRGRGLLLGVVLNEPIAAQVVQAGYGAGVILNHTSEDVVRLAPPLILTDEQVEQAAERLALAVRRARAVHHEAASS